MSIIHPKFIKPKPITIPATTVNLDSKRDVLGELFAARDRAKEEQRITADVAAGRKPAPRSATAKKRKPIIKLQTTDATTRLIQERETALSHVKPAPEPIKPITSRLTLLDAIKQRFNAEMDRMERVIKGEPEPDQIDSTQHPGE